MRALLFPGQGSQYVGMGAALSAARPAARATFEAVDEALGEPLSRLLFEGPAEQLTLTANAQPAIFALSMAYHAVLQPQAGLAAGHSLGEWSALCAAGAIALPDAVRLLRLRGQAMQETVPVGEGTMAALLRVGQEEVQGWCERTEGVVEVAAVNGPGQVVVAGAVDAVDALVSLASAEGCRHARRLDVSAPFHCSLLAPAGERLRAALADVPIQAPRYPVLHNVDGAPCDDPEGIRQRLVAQVSRPVLWESCMRGLLAAGATSFLELGPGYALAGMLKKIDRGSAVRSVDRTGELEALLAGEAGA